MQVGQERASWEREQGRGREVQAALDSNEAVFAAAVDAHVESKLRAESDACAADDARFAHGLRIAIAANEALADAESGIRRRRRVRTVVGALCLVLAIMAFGFVACVLLEYHDARAAHEEVLRAAFPDGFDDASPLADMAPDWDALRALNPDIVGWLRVPGTPIGHPIVQGENDSEYLRKGYTGDAGGFVMEGSIFLSELNEPDFSDGNNFIYGHNMNDGSMFASVYALVADPARLSEGLEFYVLSPHMNYRCVVYAADTVPRDGGGVIVVDLEDGAAIDEYVKARLAEGPVFALPDADERSFDKLFTLATCTDLAATTRSVLYGGTVEAAEPSGA